MTRSLLLGLVLAAGAAEAQAATILPTAYATWRDQSPQDGTIGSAEGPFTNFVVAGLIPGTAEDRAILEFGLAGLSPAAHSQLELTLTRNNGDTDIPLSYGVYAFSGNGLIDPDDFTAGTLVNTFTVTNHMVGSVLAIDVTSGLNTLLLENAAFAAFNIRAMSPSTDLERYTWLSGFGSGGVPQLSVEPIATPEPGSMLLLAVGILGVGVGSRRHGRRS